MRRSRLPSNQAAPAVAQIGRPGHAQAARHHVRDPRRRDAGAGRADRGPERRLHARRLVVPLTGTSRWARSWAGSWASRSTCCSAARPTTSSRATGRTPPRTEAAKPLNDATKYVASRGTPALPWGPVDAPRRRRGRAGRRAQGSDGPELQVHGSGNLIQTLLRNSLVDEFHVWVFPVVLGSGKRLFADGAVPAGLKLVDTVVSTHGRRHRHVRAGRRARDRDDRPIGSQPWRPTP